MNSLVSKITNKLKYRFNSLRWRYTNLIHAALLKRLRLSHTLPGGIQIELSSFADWAIYNDIFVDGEYDVPIRRAFSEARERVRILDLGANVGFFLKRVLHLRRTEFPHHSVEIICVEGAPATFQTLKDSAPVLMKEESVTFFHGLAGEKNGSALLALNPFHAMTGLARRAGQRGVLVDFVDLSPVTWKGEQIDLLKCDIEGAEEMVFRNYPDLLSRCRTLSIEFHLDRVNRDKCLSLAESYGLKKRRIFHENAYISVEMLTR